MNTNKIRMMRTMQHFRGILIKRVWFWVLERVLHKKLGNHAFKAQMRHWLRLDRVINSTFKWLSCMMRVKRSLIILREMINNFHPIGRRLSPKSVIRKTFRVNRIQRYREIIKLRGLFQVECTKQLILNLTCQTF